MYALIIKKYAQIIFESQEIVKIYTLRKNIYIKM